MNDNGDYENFSNAPISIDEIKSDRSGKAKDATPRSVLIAALRDLDSGKIKPDALIVSYTVFDGEGGGITETIVSSQNVYVTMGMLHEALNNVVNEF